MAAVPPPLTHFKNSGHRKSSASQSLSRVPKAIPEGRHTMPPLVGLVSDALRIGSLPREDLLRICDVLHRIGWCENGGGLSTEAAERAFGSMFGLCGVTMGGGRGSYEAYCQLYDKLHAVRNALQFAMSHGRAVFVKQLKPEGNEIQALLKTLLDSMLLCYDALNEAGLHGDDLTDNQYAALDALPVGGVVEEEDKEEEAATRVLGPYLRDQLMPKVAALVLFLQNNIHDCLTHGCSALFPRLKELVNLSVPKLPDRANAVTRVDFELRAYVDGEESMVQWAREVWLASTVKPRLFLEMHFLSEPWSNSLKQFTLQMRRQDRTLQECPEWAALELCDLLED